MQSGSQMEQSIDVLEQRLGDVVVLLGIRQVHFGVLHDVLQDVVFFDHGEAASNQADLNAIVNVLLGREQVRIDGLDLVVVGARVQQNSRDLHVSVEDGGVERQVAVVVFDVDVGATHY